MKETMDYMSKLIEEQHELFFKRMISKVLNKPEVTLKPEDAKDFERILIDGKEGYGLSYKGSACYWVTFHFEGMHIKFLADPVYPTKSN